MLSQRAALYAGAIKHGKWNIPVNEISDYVRDLPRATELEQESCEQGNLPWMLTPACVAKLVLDNAKSPATTLLDSSTETEKEKRQGHMGGEGVR